MNAYCGRGLAATYGVDVSDHIRPFAPDQNPVEALRSGEVDLAVAFSHIPDTRDPGLVALRDDRGMLASEHLTPVYRRSLRALHPTLPADLDDLSALLTGAALTQIDTAVGDGETPDQAAAEFLDGADLGPERETSGRRLVVGGAGFASVPSPRRATRWPTGNRSSRGAAAPPIRRAPAAAGRPST